MSKTTSKRDSDYGRVDKLAEQTDKVLSRVRDADESVEEYTEQELEYLDRFKELTGDAMDDEEIYDIIIKHNFDDSRIEREINEIMKYVKKKGDEYGWTKIEKGKKSKVEKKEPEVQIKQKQGREAKDNRGYKGKYQYENKSKSYAGNRQREGKENYSEEVVEQANDQQVEQEGNYRGYNNYDREYKPNYYSNNNYYYKSNYFRGRGRGYYNPRGRGGQRGRSQRYRNYYNEDSLFEREIHLDRHNENTDAQLEQQEQPDHQEIEDENFVDEHAKEDEEEKIENVESKDKANDDDSNLFNNKDIPSNIRSNIKNLFDDNDSQEHEGKSHVNVNTNVNIKQSSHTTTHSTQNLQSHSPVLATKHTGHETITSHSQQAQNQIQPSHQLSNQSGHNHHNLQNQQSQLQHQSQLQTQHQIDAQKPKRFNEEFSVSSSSMSIGTPSNKTNKITPQSQHGMSTTASTNTSSLNTPYQNTSFTQQGVPGQVKKPVNTVSSNIGSVNIGSNPNSSGTTPNPSVKTVKKNESTGNEYLTSGMPYMPPWGMSPMGFYMPQGMGGFDPSQIGANQMYPMMPMYYFPGYGYPQGEVDENIMKNKKNLNDMSQMNMGNPQPGQYPHYAPYMYYNPQNPYMQSPMGMPPMGMPSMNIPMNPQMENQGFGYDMGKNMKSQGGEDQTNAYYGFYKQA